jgi:U6 snRNA-associated Sm-like protein LSm6
MNIAMEQTEEYQNGQRRAIFGDAFIRGNNGNFL